MLWRVRETQLRDTISLVLQCCRQIQEKYSVRDTDVGLKLRLKIGMGCAGLAVPCVAPWPCAGPQGAFPPGGEVVIPRGARETFCLEGCCVLSGSRLQAACTHPEQMASKGAGVLGLWGAVAVKTLSVSASRASF